MRGRIRKIALWLFLGALAWGCISGTIIWRFGTVDHATRADCIIVLGAAVQGMDPSPVFEERIRHGVSLYKAGLASKILFTGGIGVGQNHSEGRVGASVAMVHGVPGKDLLIEEVSRTTHQNLSEALAVMRKQGLKSAIVVSDPLHMKRAMMMADGLQIDAVSSPTPTSGYRSFKTRLGFLAREIYFIHHYLVSGN